MVINSFEQNIELIRDKISDELYAVLIKLSKVNDDNDQIKKLKLEFMLEDSYIQELDWLYSTLKEQSHENIIRL